MLRNRRFSTGIWASMILVIVGCTQSLHRVADHHAEAVDDGATATPAVQSSYRVAGRDADNPGFSLLLPKGWDKCAGDGDLAMHRFTPGGKIPDMNDPAAELSYLLVAYQRMTDPSGDMFETAVSYAAGSIGGEPSSSRVEKISGRRIWHAEWNDPNRPSLAAKARVFEGQNGCWTLMGVMASDQSAALEAALNSFREDTHTLENPPAGPVPGERGGK